MKFRVFHKIIFIKNLLKLKLGGYNMSIYEIFSIIISFLGLASIVFLAIQVYLTKKHSKDMHEEQRRIQTMNVLRNWSKSLKKETRIAEKVVEKLSIEECKKLYNYTPFEVSSEIKKMMCQMCSSYKHDCENCKVENKEDTYIIGGLQLTELRGNVTNYLNNLEVVAISWQQWIVDKEVLESQFAYLYTPGTKSALENYRKVAGNGKSYPALELFYEKIKKNNSPRVKEKDEQ